MFVRDNFKWLTVNLFEKADLGFVTEKAARVLSQFKDVQTHLEVHTRIAEHLLKIFETIYTESFQAEAGKLQRKIQGVFFPSTEGVFEFGAAHRGKALLAPLDSLDEVEKLSTLSLIDDIHLLASDHGKTHYKNQFNAFMSAHFGLATQQEVRLLRIEIEQIKAELKKEREINEHLLPIPHLFIENDIVIT